ncbi:YqzH family protein [Metabacillus iocasae]|uniref:YqzH-like protein n=1 Tax=Priestia iocasae TaxID=2291674 RepID=A0ABS2QQA5_9BACI|nr:YqzH family protein [Metabacillus iocasae]MBM7701634.1 hypothetical protein [Metabacillus iocasae]
MDRLLIQKMLLNCLSHYGHESISLTTSEHHHLYDKVIEKKQLESSNDLYEIINDVVYDYLTDNGSIW